MNKTFGMDRYDRKARLNPALIVLLPALLIVVVWFPAIWTLFGAIATFVVACGVLYALTRLVRRLGHRVERKLGARIGRPHTAALLSLLDDRLSASMKTRCRSYIKAHSGMTLPSIEQEESDPKSAADERLVATMWLLEHTRPTAAATLLLDENISYGFWRNLLGLKPYGLAVSGIAVFASAWLLLGNPSGSTTFLPGFILCAVSVLALVGWLLLVTEKSVEEASQVYAEKILSLCLDSSNVDT